MKIDLTRRNTRIKDWGKDNVSKMKAEGKTMGIRHRSNSPSNTASLPKLGDRYKQRDGEIVRVSLKVVRSLIYTHKGAGKGKGGTKGSKWYNKNGEAKTTNPESMGKMNTGSRKAKPFINNVLDRSSGVEELASIVAEETGDAIVNKMLL